MNSTVLVLGVIGADAYPPGYHTACHIFSRSGLAVVDLGIMVTQAEFAAAAAQSRAAAIVVLSPTGHGELDCRGLRHTCQQAGLAQILLYVWGRLTVDPQPAELIDARFNQMGLDRTFPACAPPERLLAALAQDLGTAVTAHTITQ